MANIIGPPTWWEYDKAGVYHSSATWLEIDRWVSRRSVESGASIIPSCTYRVGENLRGDVFTTWWELENIARQFRLKIWNLAEFVWQHPWVIPVVNLHGLDTIDPYKGPYKEWPMYVLYHKKMLSCLDSSQDLHLLYELIPTLEEAMVISLQLVKNDRSGTISLFVLNDPSSWKICIPSIWGKFIPILEALDEIKKVTSSKKISFAFNCFNPCITPELVSILKNSRHAAHIVGMYPNLADAANDKEFKNIWSQKTTDALVSFAKQEVGTNFTRFIWACCGSTVDDVWKLRDALRV